MNAASRGHRSVLDFLITLPAVDLSIRNSQNECLYDVAAGKGDLSTCRVIETYERDQWSHSRRGGRPLGVLLGSLLTLCSVEFDPIIQHTIIPCVVTENSRVNSRSRLPDPRILTGNIDPPQFTPASKEDIFLLARVMPLRRIGSGYLNGQSLNLTRIRALAAGSLHSAGMPRKVTGLVMRQALLLFQGRDLWHAGLGFA